MFCVLVGIQGRRQFESDGLPPSLPHRLSRRMVNEQAQLPQLQDVRLLIIIYVLSIKTSSTQQYHWVYALPNDQHIKKFYHFLQYLQAFLTFLVKSLRHSARSALLPLCSSREASRDFYSEAPLLYCLDSEFTEHRSAPLLVYLISRAEAISSFSLARAFFSS